MKRISTKQVGYIKALMAQRKIIHLSHEIAYNHSDQRTHHVSALTAVEAQKLIDFLKADDDIATQCNTMRRKMISMAREMGWSLPNPSKGGAMVADMARLDNWCIKYGYLHKPLNEHSLAELPKLLSQFGILLNQFLNAI